MKLLFCYLKHSDSMRLGHADRLMNWGRLYCFSTHHSLSPINTENAHVCSWMPPKIWTQCKPWLQNINTGGGSCKTGNIPGNATKQQAPSRMFFLQTDKFHYKSKSSIVFMRPTTIIEYRSVVLETLTATQLAKMLPEFQETQKFITLF